MGLPSVSGLNSKRAIAEGYLPSISPNRYTELIWWTVKFSTLENFSAKDGTLVFQADAPVSAYGNVTTKTSI